MDQAQRTQGPLVIAFIHVKQVKQVNDIQGHAASNHLLRSVRAALREEMRSSGVVMRYGGDESVCALPGATIRYAARRHQGSARCWPAHRSASGSPKLRTGESLDEAINRADGEM